MANLSNENRAKDPIGSLFVPSLALSRYSTTPRGIILTLLLIEIGLTFGIPVGVAGQIATAGSVAAFIGSLLMGLLTVRYKHKSLLLTGLVVLGASTLGLYLAPSFALFMICSVLAGLGAAMIMPISTTLVGRHLPLKKRANVISMLMATMSVSIFVGTPIIQYLSGLGGWRLSYLVYALPLPALSLLLSFRGIPSESGSSQSVVDRVNVADGYRGVLSKISADVCLLCNSLCRNGAGNRTLRRLFLQAAVHRLDGIRHIPSNSRGHVGHSRRAFQRKTCEQFRKEKGDIRISAIKWSPLFLLHCFAQPLGLNYLCFDSFSPVRCKEFIPCHPDPWTGSPIQGNHDVLERRISESGRCPGIRGGRRCSPLVRLQSHWPLPGTS